MGLGYGLGKYGHGLILQETSSSDEIMEMTKRNTNRFGLGGHVGFGWQALISVLLPPFCTFECNNQTPLCLQITNLELGLFRAMHDTIWGGKERSLRRNI